MDYNYELLPVNVVTEIFTYLPISDVKNAAQTCRSWYYASCDPRITKRIVVFTHNIELTDFSLFKRPFSKLSLWAQNFNKFNYKEFFKQFGYTITDLFLDDCTIRLTQLYEILIYLCNLKKLTIYDKSRTFYTNNIVHYKPIIKYRDKIIRNLSVLRYLNVQTYGPQLRGLTDLVQNATGLEEFYINKDWYINTNENLMYESFFHSIDRWSFATLKHLDIQCLERNNTALYFEKIINLEVGNLISFGIGELSSMYYDRSNFKMFCIKFGKLQNLRIREINDMQLADICRHMPLLQEVEFENIVAGNLYEIGNLKYLRRLSIIGNVRNQHIARLFNQPLENLKSLKLEQISKDMLQCICEQKKDLEELELINLWTKDCSAIYNNLVKLKKLSIRWIIEPSNCNQEILEIDENSNITNLGELEYLSINHFVPGLTFGLIEKLPNLKSTSHRYLERSCVVSHTLNTINDNGNDTRNVNANMAGGLNYDLPDWYFNIIN